MNKLASIVIVTCNRREFTQKTLESIFANTDYPNYEVIILDNGSSDGTVAYLEKLENHPRIAHIIYFKSNQGKGRAANRGFKLAKGDYLIGLDDDVIVPQGWLGTMIAALDAIPNVGWLCMNFKNLPQDIFTPATERKFGKIKVHTPHSVGGQCVAMPRSTFQKIGGYIEQNYYGGVDSEYNMRARKHGLLTGYVVDVVGFHLGGTPEEIAAYPEYYKYKADTQDQLHAGNSALAKTNYFQETKPAKTVPPKEALKKGFLLKGATSPAVYLVYQGIKHEIPNIETFNRLNFTWSDVKVVPDIELNAYPTGETLRV